MTIGWEPNGVDSDRWEMLLEVASLDRADRLWVQLGVSAPERLREAARTLLVRLWRGPGDAAGEVVNRSVEASLRRRVPKADFDFLATLQRDTRWWNNPLVDADLANEYMDSVREASSAPAGLGASGLVKLARELGAWETAFSVLVEEAERDPFSHWDAVVYGLYRVRLPEMVTSPLDLMKNIAFRRVLGTYTIARNELKLEALRQR
jgi:hypothetical protein